MPRPLFNKPKDIVADLDGDNWLGLAIIYMKRLPDIISNTNMIIIITKGKIFLFIVLYQPRLS